MELSTAIRSGNKKVTLVNNLDTYQVGQVSQTTIVIQDYTPVGEQLTDSEMCRSTLLSLHISARCT